MSETSEDVKDLLLKVDTLIWAVEVSKRPDRKKSVDVKAALQDLVESYRLFQLQRKKDETI